jgi:hypothetical protein
MKTLRLLALTLAILGIVSVSISSAAALNVNARSLGSFAGPAACTTATLTVSSTNATGNNTATLLISNVPAACRNQAMQLTAYGSGGAVRATATTATTGSGATTTVGLDASVHLNQVTGIALTIGGWGITTDWAG